MRVEPTVTTGELERAYCAALVEATLPEITHPLCPDELAEPSLPPDTVLIEEAIYSHRRHALLAGCAVAGLVLGVFSAFFF